MTDHNPLRHYGCLLTILAILVLFQIIALVNVLQLADEIGRVLTLAPSWQILFTLIWLGAFSRAFVRIVGGKAGAIRSSIWLILGYMGYSLLRITLFAQADYDRARLPFLLMALLLLAIPLLIFLRRQARSE